MSSLVYKAPYLNDAIKQRFQLLPNNESLNFIYNHLHIDIKNSHSVTIYDPDNRFMLDKSANFSTKHSDDNSNSCNNLDNKLLISDIDNDNDASTVETYIKSVFSNDDQQSFYTEIL